MTENETVLSFLGGL